MNRDLIFFENKTVDKAAFLALSSKLANALHQRFPSHSACIAFLLNKSPEQICLFYTLLHEGYRCVPIDPIMPKERILQIVFDCSADLIVIDEANFETLGFFSETIRLEDLIRKEASAVSPAPSDTVFSISDASSVIYYTSGTSGEPKGVITLGAGLNHLIHTLGRWIFPPESGHILSLSPTTFDMFFIESILALCMNMAIVLANEDQAKNPRLIAQLIVEHDVNSIIMTPSRLQAVLLKDPNMRILSRVHLIMLGGEALPANLLKQLQEHTSAKLYNLYGPTEASVCTTVADLTCSSEVHIGKPIADAEVFLLSEDGTLSDEGEICISGPGLAEGYLHNEALTQGKFVFLPSINKRVYRTGDVGRLEPDGNLYFAGRNDNQVKLRGFRIELEEIERQIEQCSNVGACVVKKDCKADGNEYLIAYYTGEANVDELKRMLKNRLPYYMIPSVL